MSAVRRVLLAVWEFVVGDDPLTALGVVLALGLAAIVGSAGWWLLPLITAALLARTVLAARRR